MPILQTLQHKASRSRLRKLSNKREGGADATATIVPTLPRTAHYAKTDRTDVNDDDTPPPEILSPEMSTSSPNPGSSLKFWRKRAPSPSPEMTQSPFLPSLDRQKSTKSILRRRPSSSVSGSEDERESAKVTFGGRSQQRPGNNQYNPPPSSFSGPQRRPESTTSSYGAPTPPLPCPSPSLSARDRPSPGHRSSSLPTSPAPISGSSSPGSYFPPSTPANNALSPTSALPSTPMSQSRASSINSRNSNTPGGASTPSSYMSAASSGGSSGASPHLSTVSTASTSTVSPGRSFPGVVVPESPADAACRPFTPSQPSTRVAPRALTYRSSRPASTAGSSIASTIRPAPVQQSQSRPASAMSTSSASRRRVSSRPSTRSTRSTRASIASISTLTSTSSHGYSPSSLASPGAISPISPSNNNGYFGGYSGSNGHNAYPSYAGSSGSHSSHSPIHMGTQAFVFPPVQNSGRASATPTPSTPPGKHTNLIPPSLGGGLYSGDEVPMFNVIPATPGAEEDAVVEPQTVRRSSSSHRRRSSSMERTLEVMHEEDEEAEIHQEESLPARKLDFDQAEFIQPSPRQREVEQLGNYGSPIKLNTLSLDDVSSDAESDETEVRTAEEHSLENDDMFDFGSSFEDSLGTAVQSVPAPPPRFPKSPKRITQSLYQAHDDGRSISQSLAELAALACDLPPLDDDMTANAAAERLARARATVDVSEPAFDFSSPRPLSAAPVMMGNYRPPMRKASSVSPPSRGLPFTPSPEESEIRRKTMTAPPRGPLPPTPPSYSSYSSLPSLVSHDSMPSSASGCTTSSWNLHNSLTSSPESDHKMDMLFDKLSIDNAEVIDLPDNPGIGLGLGLGLGLDAGYMGEKANPSQPKAAPVIAVSPADDDLPSEVRVRPHRMSAMSAHPHRVALYGTPQLGRIHERDSYCSVASTVRHTPHGSVSSMSMMSEMSDDEVLNAQVVDITTFAHPYVVGREDARAHEVGVAY